MTPAGPLGEDDVLYYLHIPKTAGTTFNAVLETYFDPAEIWPVGERVGRRLAADLARTPPDELRRYRLIRGHYDHSIDRLFPRPPVYVTMLRHPVERTLSLYRHILRVTTHRLHGELAGGRRGVRDLLEHRMAPRRFNNRQVHQIAGTVDGACELSDAELLAVAKGRLEHEFRFFGVAERFDDSLRLLFATLEWEPVAGYHSLNVAPERASGLDPADRAAIEECNDLDMELYAFAASLFGRRVGRLPGC